MKRLASVLLAALLLLASLCVGASAASADDWKDIEFHLLEQVLNGAVFSAGAEYFDEGRYCMRGFAVSPDGRYLIGGFLNPNTNSAIEMIDTTTGKPAGTYSYTEDSGVKSYPKGLDCDDRGYLYAGLAWSPNYGTAHFAVLDYKTKDSSGYFKEISRTQILEVSTPGDKSGTKVGINGVAVQQVYGIYYLYVVVNYDVDYLYRFDVTDPAHPMLDASFGKDGRVDLHEDIYSINGNAITEGNYLDVDTDGTIYLGYTTGAGAGVLKLSENGGSLLGFAEQTKGYGVALYDDVVLVSSQNTGNICVYGKDNLNLITSFNIAEKIVLPVPEEYDAVYNFGVASICNIKVVNDVIYFADQGSDKAPDQVFAAAITEKGKAEIKKATDVLAALLHVEATDAPTAAPTSAGDQPTEAPTSAEDQPTETPTSAGDQPTEAPTGKVEEKGCGSSAALGAVLLAAVLGSAWIQKKN